jgi:hypothetical protein
MPDGPPALQDLELHDQRRGDPLAPVRGRYRQIVDVDLAALLLELAQLVRGNATHHLAAFQGGERDEVVAAQQTTKVRRARPSPAIGPGLVEGFSEHRQQAFHRRDVIGPERTDGVRMQGHGFRSAGNRGARGSLRRFVIIAQTASMVHGFMSFLSAIPAGAEGLAFVASRLRPAFSR